MAISPKLLMGAGIAVAGLGLIGAGAGATFTARVAGSTSISTGDIGLSLNGRSGSDLHLTIDGSNLGTHFSPLIQQLRLRNTGTLDIASTSLGLTATGCDGGSDAPLARALRVTVTDVTHSRQVYDGPLCSAVSALPASAGARSRAHATAGRLLHPLDTGESTVYDLVLQPEDPEQGLSPDALGARTSVTVTFTGYDD